MTGYNETTDENQELVSRAHSDPLNGLKEAVANALVDCENAAWSREFKSPTTEERADAAILAVLTYFEDAPASDFGELTISSDLDELAPSLVLRLPGVTIKQVVVNSLRALRESKGGER